MSIKTPCIWCKEISYIHHIQGVLIDSHCVVGPNVVVGAHSVVKVTFPQKKMSPTKKNSHTGMAFHIGRRVRDGHLKGPSPNQTSK